MSFAEPLMVEAGRQRSTLEDRAVGKLYADGGHERLQTVDGDTLGQQLEIEDRFVRGELIGAFDVNCDRAGLKGEIGDLATVVFEGVANLIVDIERMRGGLAAFEEDEVLGVNFAVAGDVHAV